MFTDLAGFTELTQRDERGALGLLREQESLVGPIFDRHHGRRVKSMGDGLLIEFPNALDAVECGVELQRAIAERTPREGSVPIRMRVGIHLGDVEPRGSDILGDAVNIASRVEPVADPGGVCISEPVFVQVRNKVPYAIEPLGPKILSGLHEPLTLYRIVPPLERSSRSPATQAPARIAVLPFVNMSPDPADGFFADGITEELIGRISQIDGARVIARTSVMPFKGSGKKIGEIARELGVTSLVEGSVRRSGNRLRMTVQLVDARTEEPLWTSQYDRELADVFEIQTEISSKVAAAVERQMYAGSARRAPHDVAAYTSYLRAMQLLHADAEPSLREAVRLFGQTIASDPEFALAHVGLAQAWINLMLQGFEEWSTILDRAIPSAKRAVELRPDLAETHAMLADIHGMMDHHQEAIAEAEQAIRLNPNSAVAYRTLAIDLGAVGQLDKSLAAMRKAHELDPLTARTTAALAELTRLLGHAEEGLRLIRGVHDLYPDNPRVLYELALHYCRRGEFAEADRVLAEGLAGAPNNPVLKSAQAISFAMRGRREEAVRTLAAIRGRSASNLLTAAELVVHSVLGDTDLAFRALDRMAQNHSWPWLIRSQPDYGALRSDPRFREFCRRVGIPE